MTPFANLRDHASLVACVMGAAYTLATAAGSGDNTLIVGSTINRNSLVQNGLSTITNGLPRYVVFNVAYEAILAAAATFTWKAVTIEHSATGSGDWSTLFSQAQTPPPNGWPAAGVIDTGGSGGTTQRGVIKFGADLTGAKQYVRFSGTPDLSAGATDTVKVMITAEFSAFAELRPGVM